jgi:hypothetical protein
MAKLSKTKAVMQLRSGASEAFMIEVPRGDEIKAATWTLKDFDDNVVTVPKFEGKKDHNGLRVESDKNGLYIRAGDAPLYALLKIECAVTVKSKKGAVSKQVLKAQVRFHDRWGGMAKAWYPYPEDYEMKWTADPQGRRAVALMHEMIALLPDEFRTAGGGIPIIRTNNYKSLRGEEFRGAHLPLLFDTIQISNKLVTQLTNVPHLTKEDVEFVTVVVHEIGHAVTYRKCLWGMHHQMAAIRNYMRKPFIPVVGALPAAAATVPAFILALAQEILAPHDVVSDFSEVAGWELASPLARVARYAADIAKMYGRIPPLNLLTDIGQWLWRLPSAGVWQDNPIRPNVIVGSQEFGGMFGLQVRGAPALKEAFEKADADYKAAEKAYGSAAPANKPKALARRDAAAKARDAALNAYRSGAAGKGFVSFYAASDALEDMAETLAFYLIDNKQLAMVGEYFGDRKNKVLKAKRKFFGDQHYLPAGKITPLTIGSLWRGWDVRDHLDLWEVHL